MVMFSLRTVKSSSQCIHRPPLVSPPILKRQTRSVWKLPFKLPRYRFTPFEPIPEEDKKVKVKHAKPFNPLQRPVSHREEEEDNWVATPMNGIIPVVVVAIIVWGMSEKWMRTLPVASDGQFGPMRYANDPRAKYWGNYRYDIQPRSGRRHWDRDQT